MGKKDERTETEPERGKIEMRNVNIRDNMWHKYCNFFGLVTKFVDKVELIRFLLGKSSGHVYMQIYRKNECMIIFCRRSAN